MLFDMNDFIKLCFMESKTEEQTANYFGFRIQRDGVYLRGQEKHETAGEWGERSKGFGPCDISKPVLAFPCTREVLADFLKKSGLDGITGRNPEIFGKGPDLTPLPNETPEEYVSRLIGDKVKEDIVVVGLVDHMRITGGKAVNLLFPGRYNSGQHGAAKVQGSRMVKRGRDVLAKCKECGIAKEKCWQRC